MGAGTHAPYLGADEAAEGLELGDGDGHLGLVVGVAVSGGRAAPAQGPGPGALGSTAPRPRTAPVSVRMKTRGSKEKKRKEETLPQIMVRRRREGLRRKPQTSRNFHTDVYIRAIFFFCEEHY
jgi:hypothetical protein